MHERSDPRSLALNLLGTPEILQGGEQLDLLTSTRAQALLFYLAVTGTEHTRSELAVLLWNDGGDGRARARLRKTLQLLRTHLNGALSIRTSVPYTVSLHFDSNVALDVTDFELLTAPSANEADLHGAINLYRGEFLAGFDLSKAPEFDHWVISRRQALREQLHSASSRLVQRYESNQRWAEAIAMCRHMVDREPWREETHRKLIELLAHSGDRSSALAHYQICRMALREELNVEPDHATKALILQIRSGQNGLPPQEPASAIVPAGATLPPFRFDLLDAPTMADFFGRRAELGKLTQRVVCDRCRVTAVLGIGGMGKTSLVARFVSNLVQQAAEKDAASRPFDKIIWRSLVNAPPLQDLLSECLHFLSDQALGTSALGLDAKLRLLSELLGRQRCLLILDNFESILPAGDRAGRYRPGYEDYDQLVRRIAKGDHRSCLLLTSRERPPRLGRHSNDGAQVSLLELSGLDGAAVQQILRSRGLASTPADVRWLIESYAGNPLAMKLVADTVDELYAADVAAFLQENTVIFDDVRDLLHSQFARLSTLEQSVMLWLAVKREPVFIRDLARALFPAPHRVDLLEAVRSLHRRSLVDIRPDLPAETLPGLSGAGSRFGIQNMLIEFLTEYLVQSAASELSAGEPHLSETHALIEASAKEYVRDSQVRLILAPIAETLLATSDLSWVRQRLVTLLDRQRTRGAGAHGYLTGNAINLLCHAGRNVSGLDFSGLTVRQASLQGVTLHDIDFRLCEFLDARFTDTFDLIGPVAFHPSGRLFAAGTAAGRILIWRIDKGQIHLTIAGHTGGVRTIDFAPDGRTLISGSIDQSVRLWDSETGKMLRVRNEHAGRIRAVSFSPDGSHCASAGDDGTVRLWDGTLGRKLGAFTEHSGRVCALSFSPNGQTLASGGADGTIWLRDITRGQDVRMLNRHAGAVNALAFSPNRDILASGGADQIVHLLDIASGRTQAVLTGHVGQVNSVSFSPNGQTLVSAGEDGTVRLWDAVRGRALRILHGHDGWVWSAAFSPDGASVVSGGVDRTVRLWSAADGRILRTVQGYTDGIRAIDFSPDGERLITGGKDELIRLWDLRNSQEKYVLRQHVGWVNAVCFTSDGTRIISGGEDQVAHLFDAQRGKSLRVSYNHGDWIGAICINKQGDIVATGGADGQIKLWQLAEGNQLLTLQGHTGAINDLCFGDDDHLLASASDDRTVRLWNAHTGMTENSLRGHATPVWAVAFDPTNQLLASGCAGRTICLWDNAARAAARSGKSAPTPRRFTLPAGDGAIRTLQFTPNGHMLACGDDDGKVILWDVETGDIAHVLAGHTDRVNDLAFRADGLLFASAGDDGVAIVWDVATGSQVHSLRPERPYERMNIQGATGINAAQRASLAALGAIDV